MAELLERTQELACEPRRDDPTTATGILAGVDCAPPDPAIDALALEQLSDVAPLRDHWLAGLEDAAAPIDEVDDACRNGSVGSRRWRFGDIACLVTEDRAQVRWTDERTRVHGVVTGSSADLATLFEWWRTTGRPLGRPMDEASPDANAPTPSPSPRPLVRVPRAPRSVSCDPTSEARPDVWERRWRIRNIEFLDRGNYDRVIVNLERSGRNRSDTPTQARIERMAASEVPNAVPGANAPGRGRTAIVLYLDGISDAPDIGRFRPTDTRLARELSIVDGDGSRTIVLSGPRDTCYQLRIPVWSPRASGQERRAEIFIDLQEQAGQ